MNTTFYSVGLGNNPEVDFDLLGGKGANLVKMSTLGVNVPPAIILPTILCLPVIANEITVASLATQAYGELAAIEADFGYMPLFSVRSGAKFSMPGMCDTILNVGLTNTTIGKWEKRIGERAAWDSYRRLIQMFGDVVFGIASSQYEIILDTAKAAEGVATDAELPVAALKAVTAQFLDITPDFPQTFKMQLRKAIGAVFNSWNTERAITYRNLNKISHDLGTAVILQAMVFGNMNDNSATGVLFTRNASTGENKLVGEFLVNAQGEDVVSGVRTPLPIEQMEAWNEKAFNELINVACKLEVENRDMQDIEFTVQDGTLFILQTRNAKRTGLAAVKVAVDLVSEQLITREEAFSRLTYAQYLTANRPIIDPTFNVAATGVGIAASTGFATGVAVFSSAKAVELAKTQPVILLSKETTPDDIAGMNAAVGILTQTGGASSHAAVVARGMDKVCVVGCLELSDIISMTTGQPCWSLNGQVIEEGTTKLTLAGDTGSVWVGVDVPLISPENTPEIATLDSWVQEMVPFVELVSSGTKGYLVTEDYDNDPDKLAEALSSFSGYVSIATGKDNVTSYDKYLFELVSEFDEEAIRAAKLKAIIDVNPTESITVDLCGHKINSVTRKRLETRGYKVLDTVNSLADLVFAKGVIKFGEDLAVVPNAVTRLLELKSASNENVHALVFAGDTLPAVSSNTVLVSSKVVVMKSLMSA